jgi:Na+-driven multidrug efflux pump
MKLKTKAIIYQLVSFLIFFLPLRYAISELTNLKGFWIPLTAFVITTIVSPKFQSIRTQEGEKLYMKWFFIKGLKEL